MRKFGFVFLILAVAGIIIWYYSPGPVGRVIPDKEVKEAGTFDECVRQGNPIRESYPPTCVTKSGKVLTQNIGNELELTDKIKVTNPRPTQLVKSPLDIKGQARGTWYFEGQFAGTLFDEEGNVLGSAPMTAETDWMTEDFVPYSGQIIFPSPNTKTGRLILEKSNPSGLEEKAEQLIIPVKFKD